MYGLGQARRAPGHAAPPSYADAGDRHKVPLPSFGGGFDLGLGGSGAGCAAHGARSCQADRSDRFGHAPQHGFVDRYNGTGGLVGNGRVTPTRNVQPNRPPRDTAGLVDSRFLPTEEGSRYHRSSSSTSGRSTTPIGARNLAPPPLGRTAGRWGGSGHSEDVQSSFQSSGGNPGGFSGSMPPGSSAAGCNGRDPRRGHEDDPSVRRAQCGGGAGFNNTMPTPSSSSAGPGAFGRPCGGGVGLSSTMPTPSSSSAGPGASGRPQRAERKFSLLSEKALDQLHETNQELTETERRVNELEGQLNAGGKDVTDIRTQLAHLEASSKQLESGKVDEVYTGELSTGKEECRAQKKDQLRRLEVLFTRLEGIFAKIKAGVYGDDCHKPTQVQAAAQAAAPSAAAALPEIAPGAYNIDHVERQVSEILGTIEGKGISRVEVSTMRELWREVADLETAARRRAWELDMQSRSVAPGSKAANQMMEELGRVDKQVQRLRSILTYIDGAVMQR